MKHSSKEWDLKLYYGLALEETIITFYDVFANASKAICRRQKN